MSIERIERDLDHRFNISVEHLKNGSTEFNRNGGFFSSKIAIAQISRYGSLRYWENHLKKHFDDREIKDIKQLITQYEREHQ